MNDTALQAWVLVALVLLGAHLLLTLTQVCDLWWAWRQPNRRAPRHFRRARWRLALILFTIITAAAAIITIYLLQQNYVP